MFAIFFLSNMVTNRDTFTLQKSKLMCETWLQTVGYTSVACTTNYKGSKHSRLEMIWQCIHLLWGLIKAHVGQPSLLLYPHYQKSGLLLWNCTFPLKKNAYPPIHPLTPLGSWSLHGWFAAAATVVWCLQFEPLSSPSPSTQTYIRTFPCSPFHPALLHGISLCAPRASSTLETFPPSLPPFLPLCNLSLSPASLFRPFMPFLGWVSDLVLPKRERKEEIGRPQRARKREQGYNWSPACRPLQTWPRRKAPGAAGRARVLMCLLCGCCSSTVCVLWLFYLCM